MRKIIAIILVHVLVVALLVWAGVALNDKIGAYTKDYAGVISVLSVAFGLYTTFLNYLYQRNLAFHLCVNRVLSKFVRAHTYWQPHVTFHLPEGHDPQALLQAVWEHLREGAHGAAVRRGGTPTTLAVCLDNLIPVRIRIDGDRMCMDLEQSILVPSYEYDDYRKRFARLFEDMARIVKPLQVQYGLQVSFGDGRRNPYYGFFVNRVPAELLQSFLVTFRLRGDSDCRIEAGTEHVSIESGRLSEAFEALNQVLNMKALPAGGR